MIHPSQVPGITGEPDAGLADVPRFERGKDWSEPCAIMGAYHPDGTVAWFEVLDIVSAAGLDLADVGSVPGDFIESGTVVTGGGFEFTLGTNETSCGLPPSDVPYVTLLLDWTIGEIIVLQCIDTA